MSSAPSSAANPNGLKIWLLAARPRTLPAAVAPVLVGTSLASKLEDRFSVAAFIATLAGAMLIQIGTNLANDYSDARRGADTEDRLGPVRVTAGGLVPPKQVLVATYATFGLAILVGIYLVSISGWPLLIVGLVSILAGVLYTGGPRPYGYAGLGEIFVFLFFGLVAVAGTYYVQTVEIAWPAAALAVPVGILAAAIRQEDPRSEDGQVADENDVYRHGRRVLPACVDSLALGPLEPRSSAVAARSTARGRAGKGSCHPDRWASLEPHAR